MTRRAREAHPAGKKRSPRARADEAYLDAWWQVERETARAARWHARYWAAATVIIFVSALVLWVFGGFLIWSVVR